MEKRERGFSDAFAENNSNIIFVRWKDNVMSVASILYGSSPIKKAQSYIKEKHVRIDIEEPQNVYQYNQKIGVADCLEENKIACSTGLVHRSKK